MGGHEPRAKKMKELQHLSRIKLVTRMGAGSVQKLQSESLREEAEDGFGSSHEELTADTGTSEHEG